LPPDTLILAFDTSAAQCAVALLCGDEILADRTEIMDRGQAERLFPLIAETLSDAKKTWQDITGLGVGIGPGNFTGIRLSVAAARGLAVSLGCPLAGVSALQSLAFDSPGHVLALVDARRDQSYAQRFGARTTSAPAVYNIADLVTEFSTGIDVCIGARSGEIAALIGSKSGTARRSAAVAIAHLARRQIVSGAPLARPAPLYLKPADAAPSKMRPAPLLT